MIKKILEKSGFIYGKSFKETRFLKPPQTTYAVYFDSYNRKGSDCMNLIKKHDCSIELYSEKPDINAENRIESALDSFGIEYEKSTRTWIQEEQIYQVIYDFEYIEK